MPCAPDDGHVPHHVPSAGGGNSSDVVSPPVAPDHAARIERLAQRMAGFDVKIAALAQTSPEKAAAVTAQLAAMRASPPQNASTAPPAYSVGMTVRLQGLAAVPELNGCIGTLSAYHQDRGRWAVTMPGAAEPKLHKAANLAIV